MSLLTMKLTLLKYLCQINERMHNSGNSENPEAIESRVVVWMSEHVESSCDEEQVNVFHVILMSTTSSFDVGLGQVDFAILDQFRVFLVGESLISEYGK